MFAKAIQRLAREEQGFTLLELLIALEIIIILVAIAGPAYLQFEDSANQAAAKSNAKEVSVAAALYFESNSTYAGMTIPALKAFDASLTTTGTFVNNSGTDKAGVTKRITLDASHYCTYATSGRWFVYQLNASGVFTATTVASSVCS